MVKATNTAIQLYNVSEFAALQVDHEELAEAIAANSNGKAMTRFDFDRVSVPSGGATKWEIPSPDGPQDADAIEGVIVHQSAGKSYWSRPFSGAGTPPDCFSLNGWEGIGDPGGQCLHCPFNQFGSASRDGAPAAGKACKDQTFLMVLTPDRVLPLLVVAPPSSIRAIEKYIKSLSSYAKPFYGVLTRLSLEKVKSATGIAYSQIKAERAGVLSKEDAGRMKAYSQMLVKAMEAQPQPVVIDDIPYWNADGERVNADGSPWQGGHTYLNEDERGEYSDEEVPFSDPA